MKPRQRRESDRELSVENVHEEVHLCGDAAEGLKNELSRSRPETLAERYVEARIAIHVHIRHKWINLEPRDLCIVFVRGRWIDAKAVVSRRGVDASPSCVARGARGARLSDNRSKFNVPLGVES